MLDDASVLTAFHVKRRRSRNDAQPARPRACSSRSRCGLRGATILAAVTTNANVFIPAQRHDMYAANSATIMPFTTALPILTVTTLICNFAAVPAQ